MNWREPVALNLFPANQNDVAAVQSLAAQISTALNRARVFEESLAHQKVVQELVLAGQIQAGFLPDRLPELAGWQIAASLQPARETSGDYYDLIPLADSQMGFLVADVADKGLGAALYMALSRTLIRTYAMEPENGPRDVLTEANQRILDDTRSDQFVTVFYGVLEPDEGELIYCNAGQNPPLLIKRDCNDNFQLLGRTGMALGVVEDGGWLEGRVHLDPGDVLVLYTDGITEAQGEQGEFFGVDRLIQAIIEAADRSADGVRSSVVERVRQFMGNKPQMDDITLVVLVRIDR